VKNAGTVAEKKKTTVTADGIADFLKQTGFVFEMRMSELLRKAGYSCEVASSFFDLEGDTDREIDIIATKLLGDQITLHLIIECKQSAMDKWIFICNKGNSGRFYYAVKHVPKVVPEILRDKELFSHLHTICTKFPLAHNYICYSLATEKKAV
jgi:hypothetical protein